MRRVTRAAVGVRLTRARGLCLALGLSAMAVIAVRAAEPTAELPAGGLSYAGGGGLVTEREAIVIGSARVQATYSVRNTEQRARTTLVGMALPDIDMLQIDGADVDNTAYDPQNTANYIALAAQVDGVPVEFFVESRALALGLVDVTAQLSAAKLPLYPLAPELPGLIAELAEETRLGLMARSAIRQVEGQYEPRWVLKSTMYWQQEFGPGQVRTLSASYQPIAGVAAWTAETAPTLQQRYCVPEAEAQALTARATAGAPPTIKWVNFVAYAGANARGSAATYQMTIETAEKEKAFTCRAGLTGAVTGGRSVSATNHTADEDVTVLFAE